MCSSKEKPEPIVQKEEKPYWDWWNSPQANQGINGNYRLNKLAIGDRVKATQGTSRLKNLEISPRDTTGASTSQKRARNVRSMGRLSMARLGGFTGGTVARTLTRRD